MVKKQTQLIEKGKRHEALKAVRNVGFAMQSILSAAIKNGHIGMDEGQQLQEQISKVNADLLVRMEVGF